MKEKLKLLIVDDEPIVTEVLEELFRREGFTTFVACNGKEALSLLVKADIVLLDLMLPDINGLELLPEMLSKAPSIPIIVITAYSSVESAVEALKKGAYHYVSKPFDNREIVNIVKQAAEKVALSKEVNRLRLKVQVNKKLGNIIGNSKAMQEVFFLLEKAAPASSNVLILGESGTGKELVAKALHELSPRSKRPFIVINTTAVPRELLESTLFGHVKGAFTGALISRRGLFEEGDGGSIFFDEIGDIDLSVQAKLLRVIQEKEFMPVGSNQVKKVDVRIIAATNVDLEKRIEEGKFRSDLYYRLNVITIKIPPLRERKEDIPLLVEYFVEKFAKANKKKVTGVSSRVMAVLLDYDWPGNVRELENVIERAVVLCTDSRITLDLLPDYIIKEREDFVFRDGLDSCGDFRKAVREFEKRLVLKTLAECNWVQRKAAKKLGLQPSTFHAILKRLNIEFPG